MSDKIKPTTRELTVTRSILIEELMRALIRDYSRAGDTVLDPCCGAGTCLRAALDSGRKAVGIDIKEEHCALTVKRLRQGVLPGIAEAAPQPKETP